MDEFRTECQRTTVDWKSFRCRKYCGIHLRIRSHLGNVAVFLLRPKEDPNRKYETGISHDTPLVYLFFVRNCNGGLLS